MLPPPAASAVWPQFYSFQSRTLVHHCFLHPSSQWFKDPSTHAPKPWCKNRRLRDQLYLVPSPQAMASISRTGPNLRSKLFAPRALCSTPEASRTNSTTRKHSHAQPEDTQSLRIVTTHSYAIITLFYLTISFFLVLKPRLLLSRLGA